MKVLGMGNALVDVLAQISNDNPLEKLCLPKGSMQLIDETKLQLLNAEIANIERQLASGGSASNTITSLGELGIETGFLGKIGKDEYGKHYKGDLEKYKVKSHLIEVDYASGVATTFISKDGERTFGTYLGAAADMKAEDLNESIFKDYQYFYIEGYLVQNLSLIRKALKLAKANGLKIALDLASYNVVEDHRDFLLEIIPEYVDILFANKEEIKSLLNLSAQEALPLLKNQVEIAIVKVGSNGSWIQRKDELVFIETDDVKRVDTTGAGDLYAAGFLYGLIKDYPLCKCGEFGTMLAQEVIQVIGAKLEEAHWKKIKQNLK